MTIEREILIYNSLPFKKYRWLSYMSAFQVGFLLLNLVVQPTPALVEDHRRASNEGKSEKKPKESGPKSKSSINKTALWQQLQDFNYDEVFSVKNLVTNIRERPYFSVCTLAASVLMTSAATLYAHRMAHAITLLPKDRVRFSYFSILGVGKPPYVEMPLRDVSCVLGRQTDKNYSILKFKGYIGYHLVHKSEGLFLNPKLYDKHLGYERAWASRK